ncbi:MAG TPA: ABC-three component system middle component 5 [Chryseosolibacter sp.]
MIVYHQAYDLYHAVYRMVQLLHYFNRSEFVEIERLRIWDYYLLFPNKMRNIKLKRDEKDIREIIGSFIERKDNEYEQILDDKKMFERIKAYQMSALKCLASYGIINKDYITVNRVKVLSKETLTDYLPKLQQLSNQELNAIKLLTSHFYQMSLIGEYGLKERSRLLESRYDAEQA